MGGHVRIGDPGRAVGLGRGLGLYLWENCWVAVEQRGVVGIGCHHRSRKARLVPLYRDVWLYKTAVGHWLSHAV